jgi:hypothetical protein
MLVKIEYSFRDKGEHIQSVGLVDLMGLIRPPQSPQMGPNP